MPQRVFAVTHPDSAPPVELNGFLVKSEMGWDLSSEVIVSQRRVDLLDAFERYKRRFQRSWSLGTPAQMRRLEAFVEVGGSRPGDLLALLRGHRLVGTPVVGLLIDIDDLLQSMGHLTEMVWVLLRPGHQGFLHVWDGQEVDRDLASDASASLRWCHDGLILTEDGRSRLVSGWESSPAGARLFDGHQSERMGVLATAVAPFASSVRVLPLPLRTVWVHWLGAIAAAGGFARRNGTVLIR